MLVDLAGRVRNTRLPTSRPLLPLFDAVVNAIHAIEDAGVPSGRIDITLERDNSQGALHERAPNPITGFTVADNGLGFTDRNLESFKTSDTTLKIDRGGKGIGRFLWLKAFDRAEISSIFTADDGRLARRSFGFSLAAGGVCNEKTELVLEGSPGSVVRLCGYKEHYRTNCPISAEVISRKLTLHCMSYLLSPDCPQITIGDGADLISVNRWFEEHFGKTATKRTVGVRGHDFEVVHLRLYGSDEPRHLVHYCAHHREVLEENLAQQIPDLHQGRLADEEGELFFCSTYVSGAFLDAAVNNERTGFTVPDVDLDLFPEELSFREIRETVAADTREHLRPHLAAVEKEKFDRIERFVQQRAPQYRPLLGRRDLLDSVPGNVSDESMDLELHRAKLRLVSEVKTTSQEFLRKPPGDLATQEDYRQRYRRFAAQLSELVKSELAEYIVHRKLVLDLLQRAVEVAPDGRYALEESVHSLVFPLRATSDEIDYSNQNLWVIDEKLSYHRYLASDRPIAKLDPLESEERDRPDLIVFNEPIAFVEDQRPFGSIVIIEFKRPLRVDYDDDKNPISQVYGYIRKIRDGKAIDRSGRPVSITNSTPFYCYILCDLTPKLREYAENASLVTAPDGHGYFGFNQQHTAYVEVIAYDKAIADARKRNQVLFEKLGLPS